MTGRRLLDGIRELALERFGLLARAVFERWGVRSTEDFGNIVFLLVENEQMSKTEEDSIDDFRDGYDFAQTFEDPKGLGFALESE